MNARGEQQASSATKVERRYPAAPLVGVAAAVFDHEGRVLLVQRGRPPRAGEWGLPGGLLELGETLANGVKREVREECGIEIDIGDIAGAFEPIERDSEGRIEYHYVVIDFWATYRAGIVQPADDARAAIWTSSTELQQYDLRPETVQVILDARRAWAKQRGSFDPEKPAESAVRPAAVRARTER